MRGVVPLSRGLAPPGIRTPRSAPLALLRASLGGGDPASAAMLLLPVQHAHGEEAGRHAAREVERLAAARGMAALQRQLGAFLHRSTED